MFDIKQYGRGAGFVTRSLCEKHNKENTGCEQHEVGGLFYPKCRSGYQPVGCCICSTIGKELSNTPPTEYDPDMPEEEQSDEDNENNEE